MGAGGHRDAKTEEAAVRSLLELIPTEQIKRVFHQEHVDIDYEFIGFIDIYKSLSLIIPKHFTVIDLGCAYNPQCFYFQEHKEFIAVDEGAIERFRSGNCTIYAMRIAEFIEEHLHHYNLDETFAICSYVGDEAMKLARKHFRNLFTYYPHGPKLDLMPKPKMPQGGDCHAGAS